MATPCACCDSLERKSNAASAVKIIDSNNFSIPKPDFAETSTNIDVPPYSSGNNPYSES